MSRTRSNFSQTVASSWLSLVATSACQLITIPIALSELSKADFALYAVISQMLMAVMLAEFGVRSACSRLLIDARAKGEEAYRRMWMASSAVFCLQAALMLLIVFGLAPFIGPLFHLDASNVSTARGIFIAVGAIQVVNYALSINSTSLFAGQQLKQVNLLTTVSTLVQLVVFTVAIKGGLGLWAYVLGILAQASVAQVLAFGKALNLNLVVRPRLRLLDYGNVKTVFALAADLFVAALFSMVLGNSLLIFSGHLLSLEVTAALAINYKLVTLMTHILQRIPGSAGPMLMKMVSEGNDHQYRVWWQFITKSSVSLALFAAGAFVICNGFLIRWWTGNDMLLPFWGVILISLVPFRYLVHYQFVYALAIFKEIRKVKLMLFWEVALYIGLAYGLGRAYGLNGLLSASLLSMFGGALPSGMKWLARFSGIPLRRLVVVLVRLTLPPAALFFLIALFARPLADGDLYRAIGLSVVWVLVLAPLVSFIAFEPEERKKMIGILYILWQRGVHRKIWQKLG